MHPLPFPARIFLDFRSVSLHQGVEVNFKRGGQVGKLPKLTVLYAPSVPGALPRAKVSPQPSSECSEEAASSSSLGCADPACVGTGVTLLTADGSRETAS